MGETLKWGSGERATFMFIKVSARMNL